MFVDCHEMKKNLHHSMVSAIILINGNIQTILAIWQLWTLEIVNVCLLHFPDLNASTKFWLLTIQKVFKLLI